MSCMHGGTAAQEAIVCDGTDVHVHRFTGEDPRRALHLLLDDIFPIALSLPVVLLVAARALAVKAITRNCSLLLAHVL